MACIGILNRVEEFVLEEYIHRLFVFCFVFVYIPCMVTEYSVSGLCCV